MANSSSATAAGVLPNLPAEFGHIAAGGVHVVAQILAAGAYVIAAVSN